MAECFGQGSQRCNLQTFFRSIGARYKRIRKRPRGKPSPRRNQYKGFTTQESINADKVVDYLDMFSFLVKKKTVIVLDNASVHRNAKIKELRSIWEKRGLLLFYLPPYSPELNPAEILWRVLKTKWIIPVDYETTDSLFYSTNRALASVGAGLFVKYSY